MKKQKFYVRLKKSGELRKIKACGIEELSAVANERFGADAYDIVSLRSYVKVSRKELKKAFQALTSCDDRTADLLASIRSI